MNHGGTLLIVDDDRDVLTAARLLLRNQFASVITASDPGLIETQLAAHSIDVFLLDMNFAIGRNSGAEGLHWLRRILDADPDAVVVLMTAFGDLNTAVRAMREGAADFVLKPWNNDKLLATLHVAASLRRSRTTVRALSASPPPDDMVAGSAAMQKILHVIRRVAPTEANVLIRGENGTGKELVAEAIHRQSPRAAHAMVAIDLGAVPESLFESELFGHRAGAYTGADRDRPGRFVAADGGTLFLDEIGNLPADLQSRLLRVLESREVVPLGSDRPVHVDVRLIAATNRPLEAMIEAGQFREDLKYRLNTIEINLPALRDRQDDLPDLVGHFLRQHARKYGQPVRRVTDRAMRALAAHSWPGNIRELSHVLERALILGDGDVLDEDDLSLARPAQVPPTATLNLDSNERQLVHRALGKHGGNISRAAADLGITRAALYRRIEKFSL